MNWGNNWVEIWKGLIDIILFIHYEAICRIWHYYKKFEIN